MRIYARRKRQDNTLESKQEKWIRGLNTLVSSSQIRDDELSSATDIQLVEDGKIQCPRDGQDYFGSSSGSRVTGLFPYYQADGTRELLRTSGTVLQKYNTSTSGWDNVTGATYTTTLRTEGVTAYDKLYLENGTDNLSFYDGTDITTFTSISAPTITNVARTGTTGSFTFSYKVTAVNATGESTASAADSDNLNQAVLDSSNYMTITWGAVTDATGYNIYGRKDGFWTFITYLEGNGSTTYVDKGTITPSPVFTPPEGNSTGGQKGKYISLYKDSLFISGDPDNPSRLYYSGGGDNITDFTIGGGGGFIDISKNDGQKITGSIVFKNSLIVFKEESIYQFEFDSSGLPSVTQINPAIGCVAPRSIVAVENDIFFASRRGIFTIGNEAGFAFDVLRTNELSSRVRSIYNTIDSGYIDMTTAVYATTGNVNLVVFSYTPSGATTNQKALVYDRERLAWYHWTNITANCWANYRGSDGAIHVLYGDDGSGYVKEILTGTDDFGTAIEGSFQLKSIDFKDIARYKNLKDISVVLRKPSGNANLSVIVDGTTTTYSANISTISPSINWGHYVLTEFLLGESYGSGSVTTADEIVLRTKRNLNSEGKTFALSFDNGSSGASFTLLAVKLSASERSLRYRRSGDIITG